MSTLAYADRAGVIRFTEGRCPDGALPIVRGDEHMMARVRAHARHAYDNKTLLVPGVPEADDDIEAVKALSDFCQRIRGNKGGV